MKENYSKKRHGEAMFQRDWCAKSLTKMFFALFFALILNPNLSFADGSKDLYPAGMENNKYATRATMVSSIGPGNDAKNPFPNYGDIYVYVKKGEILYVASSVMNAKYAGSIVVTSPSGKVILNKQGDDKEIGFIADRTKELAGPNYGSKKDGYNAIQLKEEITETGIYTVSFRAKSTGSDYIKPGRTVAIDFNQNDAENFEIAAFDVSVGDGTQLFPGRAYCTIFNGHLGNNFESVSGKTDAEKRAKSQGWYSKMYVLTDDGYIYIVDANGQNGFNFCFFANNKGVVSNPDGVSNKTLNSFQGSYGGTPTYQNLKSSNTIPLNIKDPRYADYSKFDNNNEIVDKDITHKMFFAIPDLENMPQEADIYLYDYQGKNQAKQKTWLNSGNQVELPKVTDLKIVGIENNKEGLIGPEGSYISFNASASGEVEISLVFNDNENDKLVIKRYCDQGENKFIWDGKKANGEYADGASVYMKAVIKSAEVHFPFNDVETNYYQDGSDPSKCGVKISLLKDGKEIPQEFYYRDNKGQQTAQGVGNYWLDPKYGNDYIIDNWVYIQGEPAIWKNKVYVNYVDLSVKNVVILNPCEDKYCKIRVGETIKYEITLENIYTNNGTFYDFKNNTKKTGCATYEKTLDEIKAGIDFISGIEITNITAKNGNTCNFISNTEEPNHSIAEFSLEKGGTITLTIEALVTAKAAHKTFTPNAYVLRPGDFKDLDATNFDANGIPKDPYIESYWGDFSNFEQNKHTTNNIKASDKIICVLNSNPQANPDVVEISKNYSTIEGGNVIKALLSGEQKDIDIDNDEITLSSAKFEETNIPLGKDFEILQNNKKIGTININSDGSYKFVPVANSSNNVTIQYFIKDSYIPETNSLLKSLGDNQGTSNSTLKFNFYNNVPILNKTDYVVDFSGETFKLDWSDIDGDNLKNIIITQSDNYFSVVDNSGTIKVAVDAPTESQTIKVKLVDERNGESIEYTINIKISNSASLVATANTSFVEINNSASLTTSLKPSSLSPSYQWKKDGENISDETNSSFTATESIAGLYTYNCVATDKDLKTITSNDVKIRFYQKPEISVSDFVENGENITFTGNNTEATYSWEVSSDGGKTWTTISGETGKDLIVKAEENKLWRRVDTYTEGKVASNSEGALIYTIQPSIYQCFDWNNLNITLDATLKNANSGAEISDAQYVWKSGETTKTIKVSPNKGVNNYYVTITSPSFPNKKWGYKFVINVLNTSNTNDPIIYSEDFILNSTEKYILTQEEFKNDEVKLSGVGTYQVKKYLVKSDNSSCLFYQDNVTIKKKEPKVTIKTNPEMTYGDLLNNVVDIDTKDVDGKLYVVIDGKRYDVNESTYYAGTYNNIDVVFVPNNSDYSEIHLGPIDFKINKKVITVPIYDKFEKDYDGNRKATINQPKLKIGNDEVILIATAEYDTPNASKSKNDKKVTVSLNFPTGSNYDDNYEVKPENEYYLGTINKAKLTINENIKDDNPSKTYDGTNTATLTEKYTVTINGNPVNVVPTATYNDENQGKNKTVDVLFTFTDENSYAENYEINKTLTTGTITQKEITVELSAQDKIYDGTNYLTPGSYNQKDDFVKGDKVSLNVDNWRFESSEIGAKAQVNVEIVDDIYNNYKLVTKGLTAKIIPPNTLTINAKDEPILGTVETQIDVIGGITANYPDATDGGKYVFYVDDKEVNSGEKISEGIHTIKVEYYNEKGIKITDATKTITVKKVDIDFTCPESATYATTEAIIGGGITANPKTTVTDAEIHYFIGDKEYKEGDRIPSGNQTIIVKYVLDNKVIGETKKSINVEKAKYYADKIENADKVYDGTKNVNDNFSISSTKNYSDKLTYVIETKEYTSENAGTCTINIIGHLTGNNSEHYQVVKNTYLGEIYSKLITIENIVANDKIYDGNVDATIDPKYIVNGIIIGDDVVVSVSSAKFDNPEVGNNKQVTVEFSLSGNDKANYSINDKKLQANINPAIDVVFTINDDEFEYGSKIGEEISAKITDKNGNVLTDGDVEYFIVDNDGNKLPISDGTILRPNDYQIVVKYSDDTKGVLEYSKPITITVSPKVITATSEVKSSKPYDGNKSADASNAKINQKQVLDGDDVKIAIKTSEYETEKIGKQSIIVEYVLTGEDAECYVVKPSKFDGEIYSSNIKVVPNPDGNLVYTTKVDEDEVVAGFCPDTDVDVKAIVEGNPDECLIDFDENAVSQGLVNTGWININNSTFHIPANAKAGKYTGYITYRKGDVQSEKYSFAFEIYLGTEYADSKFHDVVFVNNNIDGYNFVEFQWYFGQEENNLEIVQNETKQFYQDKRGENRGLDGWYSAQVTTDDNRTLMTCPFYRSNIEILDAIKIVVAPNPIKNMEEFRVIITSANPEKLKTATLSITTASGSVVKETNKVERTNFFRLKTGEYAVQVIIDGIPYSEKFIVR
ncbi:MAG: YDG domain-containing protein [Bacteroidales bacterium]|nr:YDG domain-containing protein [Bacteroidales bacterium]